MDSWESSSVVSPCEAMSGRPGLLWEAGKLASMPGKQAVPAMERGHSESKGLLQQVNDV